MNVVIVHGSNINKESAEKGLPENKRHWCFWLQKELEKRGIEVSNKIYPRNWSPIYDDWKEEFEKNKINEESVLIGHSAGGGFLVRWLGETNKKVKKLILVSPAIIHSGGFVTLDNLLKFEINKEIKNNIGKIVIFTSDNDFEGVKKSVKIFSEALGIKPIILKNRGHFREQDIGTKEFPELLEEILN